MLAGNKDFAAKRLAAGLSLDDIRGYWNQTPLMIAIQNKVLELPDYIALHTAMQLGKSEDDMTRMSRDWRTTKARWGNPEKWNAALPVNKGFDSDDADIYIEFFMRVSSWQAKTTKTMQQSLLTRHRSYNAMLRALIRDGIV